MSNESALHATPTDANDVDKSLVAMLFVNYAFILHVSLIVIFMNI